jgi:hypothetical protein
MAGQTRHGLTPKPSQVTAKPQIPINFAPGWPRASHGQDRPRGRGGRRTERMLPLGPGRPARPGARYPEALAAVVRAARGKHPVTHSPARTAAVPRRPKPPSAAKRCFISPFLRRAIELISPLAPRLQAS